MAEHRGSPVTAESLLSEVFGIAQEMPSGPFYALPESLYLRIEAYLLLTRARARRLDVMIDDALAESASRNPPAIAVEDSQMGSPSEQSRCPSASVPNAGPSGLSTLLHPLVVVAVSYERFAAFVRERELTLGPLNSLRYRWLTPGDCDYRSKIGTLGCGLCYLCLDEPGEELQRYMDSRSMHRIEFI